MEVVEIGCPAVHETFADRDLTLPNDKFDPVSSAASASSVIRREMRCGHGGSSPDSKRATLVLQRQRMGWRESAWFEPQASTLEPSATMENFLLLFVLHGELSLHSNGNGSHRLHEDES
jgi:hypothetical protein